MDGYNGYRNYETWLVALHLQNEYGVCKYWEARAEQTIEECNGDKTEAKFNLASEMEEMTDSENPFYIEMDNPVEYYGMYVDLMNAALGRVCWSEVAEVFTER